MRAYRARYLKAVACLGKDRDALLAMIYKPGMSAEQHWRGIRGARHLARVIDGVTFKDGIEVNGKADTGHSRSAA